MVKRIVAVPLWFVSVWLIYGLLAYFTGLPENAGAILGAMTSAFVFMDPTGAFWHATGSAQSGTEAAVRGIDRSHSAP